MKYLLITLFLLPASAKAQNVTKDIKPVKLGFPVIFFSPEDTAAFFKPDTILVVRNISNETRSTFWRQVDNRPFPCKLMEIREINKEPRYLKKMGHGWEPIPAYYKVWNN